MTHWNLENHGDRREKQWWSEIKERFPSYEEAWRTYVAPQTYRVADESVLYVRPDAPYPKLANANYGTFAHLAEAHAELDLDPDLSDHVASYVFFSRLFSAQDVAKRFGSSVRGLLRDLGQDTPKDLGTWLGEQGAADTWATFKTARDLVSDYRLTFVHDIEPVRVDGRIPRSKYIKSYTDLSRLAFVLADQSIVDREFQPIREIATELLHQLECACEGLWRFFLDQLDTVDASSRVADALATVTHEDGARLRAILARREAERSHQRQTGPQSSGPPDFGAPGLSGLSGNYVSRRRGQ